MATIELMCSNSMRGVIDELLPRFQSASGHRVAVRYDPAKLMLKRIMGGETGDVAIVSSGATDELVRQGVIASETRRLARSSVGMAVAAGAVKPDISSVDAFKAAILAARSVAYTIDGASGMHFAELIERLGIAQAVRAKAKRQPGGLVGELVARGEAEVAVQQLSELKAVPGIDIVGPLPQAIQKTTVIAAGVFRNAVHAEAAHALIDFLATDAAAETMTAKGLEPARPA
jgi:molybdate transport system substrate-binding protein